MSGICAVGIEFERHVIHVVAALKRRAVDGDAHGVRAEGGQVGVDEAADGDVFAAGAEGLDVAGVGVAEVDRQRSRTRCFRRVPRRRLPASGSARRSRRRCRRL